MKTGSKKIKFNLINLGLIKPISIRFNKLEFIKKTKNRKKFQGF